MSNTINAADCQEDFAVFHALRDVVGADAAARVARAAAKAEKLTDRLAFFYQSKQGDFVVTLGMGDGVVIGHFPTMKETKSVVENFNAIHA